MTSLPVLGVPVPTTQTLPETDLNISRTRPDDPTMNRTFPEPDPMTTRTRPGGPTMTRTLIRSCAVRTGAEFAPAHYPPHDMVHPGTEFAHAPFDFHACALQSKPMMSGLFLDHDLILRARPITTLHSIT